MNDSYEHVLIEDQTQWQAWLDANHGTSPGIWLVTWKKASGRPSVSYDVIVDEALAYGWVDSRPRRIDEHRSARLLTPRKPASNWSARNKARVEQLTADGRMYPAGLAAVAAARANGAWTALDETETLAEPVPLENRIRLVTGRCLVLQAACVYSLIRPLRIGFRRICCVSMPVTVARGPSRSSSGTCCAMPW